MDQNAMDDILARIKTTINLEDVAPADMVIEAAPDSPDIN